MSNLTLPLVRWLGAWDSYLLEMIGRSTIVMAVALIAIFVLRRQSAALRHQVCVAFVLLILTMPLVMWLTPDWNVLPGWMSRSAESSPRTTAATENTSNAISDPPSESMVETRSRSRTNRDASYRDDPSDRAAEGNDEPDRAATGALSDTLRNEDASDSRTDESASSAPHESPDSYSANTAASFMMGDAALSSGKRWLLGLGCVWAVGFGYAMIRIAASMFGLELRAQRQRVAFPIEEPARKRLTLMLDRVQRQLKVPFRVRLVVGSGTAMPMAWGAVRKHVMIPKSSIEWSDELLKSVLIHEVGHLARQDPLKHYAAQLAFAVYWFHPLCWVMRRTMDHERERACDDLVLRTGIAPRDYARHLVEVISRRRRNGWLGVPLTAAGIAMASTDRIETRIRAVLDRRRNRRVVSVAQIVWIGFAVAVIGSPIAVIGAKPVETERRLSDSSIADETRTDETSVAIDDVANAGAGSEDENPRLDDVNPIDDVVVGEVLLGFDLSSVPFAGDWSALFAEGGQLDRSLPIAQGGYWSYADPRRTWFVYYCPIGKYFYARLRDASGDRYYGPFEGNAVDALHLESYLAEFANDEGRRNRRSGSGAMRAIERMIDCREETLAAAGLRALFQIDDLQIYEFHRVRPLTTVALELLSGDDRSTALVAEAIAFLQREHDRLEALKIEYPADNYEHGRAPTMEENAAAWGESAGGLQVALDPWLEQDRVLTPGETVQLNLLIKNVSDEPKRISTLEALDGVSATLRDETSGHAALVSFSLLTGIAPIIRYEFAPGEVVTIKRFNLSVDEGRLVAEGTEFDPNDLEIQYDVLNVLPGHEYSLDFRLSLPSATLYDAEGRISLPARGEFHGTLSAGQVTFTAAGTPQDDASLNDATLDESIEFVDEDGWTRLRPADVDERAKIEAMLRWGNNVRDGWRIGARLISADADRELESPLRAGTTVAVEYFLQNTTDEPQSVVIRTVAGTSTMLGGGGDINFNARSSRESLEFTAQPGEAVSPRSFTIELDTTGFYDGDYTIGSTAVFWRPSESGNGASSPWRVPDVPLKIGRGGSFDEDTVIDSEGVAWGGTIAGLQVGLRLKEGRTAWKVGSRIEGEIYVRNVTDRPIDFAWNKPAPLDQNQVVHDSEGEYVRLNRTFFTGARPLLLEHYTAEPMVPMSLGNALLDSRAEASDMGPSDPAQLVAPSGEFTWKVYMQLPQESIPGVAISIGSGHVPLVISPDDD